MLPTDEKIVFLSTIDIKDSAFRITTEEKVDDLVKSFGNVGLVNLPILVPEAEKLNIVSGFRRVRAAACKGWEMIHARILPESFPKRRCAEIAVTENTFQRQLNLIEISRCLLLLRKHLNPPESLSEIAAALGLPAGQDICQKILSLSLLP